MKIDKEFKVFFSDYFIPVCQFIKRYTGENEPADIAQEVFVKVYQRWSEFKTIENTKAFLYTVCRNMCLDYLKHKKAEDNYIRAFPETQETIEHTFLKEVTRQETFRILYNAIERLPGQTRKVILLTLEGDSVQEVGHKMGISVNTVKTLKKNAYSALRNLLPQEYIVLLWILLGKL